MAIAAACTALTAYLLGDVINQAYVHKNFHGILLLGGITVVGLHRARRRALRPGGAAVAHRQPHRRRRTSGACSHKLLTENLGFFADRHSSEFIARLTAGATAATQVLNLLITAVGRDFFTLIGLVVVMVMQDPLHVARHADRRPAGDAAAAQADPPHPRHRRAQFTGGTRILETHAGDAAGHAHRQGLHARRRDARALRRQRRRGRARGEQMGARRQPRQPADGDARRLRDRGRHHLRRLSRHRSSARRRASSSPSSPRSCSPTSRPSAWRASTSISTAAWSACACCSRSSTARRPSPPTTTSRR